MISVNDDYRLLRVKKDLQEVERGWTELQSKGVFNYCCVSKIPQKICMIEAESCRIEIEINMLYNNRDVVLSLSHSKKLTGSRQECNKNLIGSKERELNLQRAARLDGEIEVLKKIIKVLQKQISILRSVMAFMSSKKVMA